MKKYKLFISVILIVVLQSLSCTKVVDINLNDSSPKIIIQGSISDQRSSCIVKLSETINFDEPNIFPAVTGAVVVIRDNVGNSAILNETSPGIYTAPLFRGVAGRTYFISIISEGKTYSASSTLQYPVNIDTILQDSFTMGSFGGGGIIKFLKVQFYDQEGLDNYYRFVEEVNGIISNSIHLEKDLLNDGNNITQEIVRIDSPFQTGDSVVVYLQTIDRPVFDYLYQLSQITNGYGDQSAPPANPVSNFGADALGYFSAYSVRHKEIVIR